MRMRSGMRQQISFIVSVSDRARLTTLVRAPNATEARLARTDRVAERCRVCTFKSMGGSEKSKPRHGASYSKPSRNAARQRARLRIAPLGRGVEERPVALTLDAAPNEEADALGADMIQRLRG